MRAAPVLAAAVKLTVPLPVPVLPEVIVIHGELLVAVQVHPAEEVVTVMLPVPPAALTFKLIGVTVKSHPDCWLMVKVCPPAVIVPVRGGPAFGCTVKAMVPLPVPLLLVTVIQGALLTAVHVQPATVVILKLPLPPATGTVAFVGFKVKAHPLA